MPDLVNVRRLTTQDDPQAATALLQRFFREEGFDTPDGTIAANLRAMLTMDRCAVLLAEDQGEAVGVATVSMDFGIEYGWSAELGDLYVLPSHRGRGLSRALMIAAEDWLRGMGAVGYQVSVTPHGADADLRRFYLAHGFADEGRALLYKLL
ncbi:MAG: GNAT family N-acetyltransferase [Aestuariivirga sp.]|uniref:GNAT family N-acetyltransferase n=1 Tax=Aestuariivirga sp. TaxID=2650926 RepID=UPI0025C1C27E|nr:GNAT family N-acetyltransferase [Aestuariivirga sp.]MCA3560276.1 GNAT family N-acetyltransferase [Aestuariivirga sp.]